jgi:Mn-dependent DtxR family transcriptional regulator
VFDLMLSKQTEVTELKKIRRQEAERQIVDYVKSHPWARTSDIIFDLKLDPFIVDQALKKLEQEGRIRSREPVLTL